MDYPTPILGQTRTNSRDGAGLCVSLWSLLLCSMASSSQQRKIGTAEGFAQESLHRLCLNSTYSRARVLEELKKGKEATFGKEYIAVLRGMPDHKYLAIFRGRVQRVVKDGVGRSMKAWVAGYDAVRAAEEAEEKLQRNEAKAAAREKYETEVATMQIESNATK